MVRPPRILRALAVLVAILTVALLVDSVTREPATSGPAQDGLGWLPSRADVRRPAASHLAVVVMENRGYREVIGNRRAPFLNRLARRYALATHFYAVSHPSLPNYLALTTGTTFGLHRDGNLPPVDGPSLFSQLSGAGLSWRAYVSGVPSACFRGIKAPGYQQALNPFVHLEQVTSHRAQCGRVEPLPRLGSDLRSGHLPALSWITPSLCADTHSCPVGVGDRYLSRLVPPLLRGLGPHGELLILWDEGTTNRGCCGTRGGGRIPALIVGPTVRRDARVATPLDSYAALRAIEQSFGLPPLRHARSVNSDPLADVVRGPASALKARGPGSFIL